MVILQEYLYSDFDWRIGIIDNQPLFACKYYMSKGHWQIYNWGEKGEENEGDHDTFQISEVPKIVLDTALKAAALIGDGLYGVDLKMVGDKVYVIEVNDNPNIDDGIEDMVLGEAIYDKIMDVFCTRIENYKNFTKLISV
jgi:glutathione synthase/RimK-type ligase-like ATP-grasp enzyme